MRRVRGMLMQNIPANVNGEGIVIAVLDSGVSSHPDLVGRILCFKDFVKHRAFMYDDNGHGTHVCGILCGSGECSEGRYRGVAPGTKLVVGKVLDENGDGMTGEMLRGLEWVLENQGKYNIRILNISVGIGNLSEKEKERALQDKIEEVWRSGILVVCAAGNKGPRAGSISVMGASKYAVTVGCHDGEYCKDNPKRCDTYSGRGMWGMGLMKPDVVSPGTDIVSCNAFCQRAQGKYITPYISKSGTSMATPIVAGACALMLQKYPEINNEECKHKLQLTATDLHISRSRQGWGMLNIDGLLY